MKRGIDIALGVLGLLIGAPVMAIAAAVIWRKEGPPVLYRSERVGRGGRIFLLLKLRTMSADASLAKPGSVTVLDDPRVTRTGSTLRGWKIDELPQLVNVLLGDMSIVGPRPEVPEYVELYTETQREILRYHPGMTSPASITFVNEARLLSMAEDPGKTYLESVMPEEIRIDLEYMRHATVWSDLRVIAKTFSAILAARRAPA